MTFNIIFKLEPSAGEMIKLCKCYGDLDLDTTMINIELLLNISHILQHVFLSPWPFAKAWL